MRTVESIGVEFGIHPLFLQVAMEVMQHRVMHSAVHDRQGRNGQNNQQGARAGGAKEMVGIKVRKESKRGSRKTRASPEMVGKPQQMFR